MPGRSASVSWSLLVMLGGILANNPVTAEAGWKLTRPVTSYDRYYLTDPGCLETIKKNGNLACYVNKRGESTGASGWFEYDFDVPHTGWYELRAGYHSGDVEYIIDSPSDARSDAGVYIYGSHGMTAQGDKISNLWLTAGKHKLRIQRYIWTGFPPIPNFSLQQSTSALTESIRASLAAAGTIFRKDECPPLQIFSGGRDKPDVMTILINDTATGARRGTTRVSIPAVKNLDEQRIPIYCQQEGRYTITFGDAVGRPFSNQELRKITYEVIDTSSPPAQDGKINKTLVQEIDCSNTPPDYSDDGGTHIVRRNFGSYRESGESGWIKYQFAKLRDPHANTPEPSWFAYKLNVKTTQQPYLVEVDYPDDALRTFAIALRESAPLSYPIAAGVDSGGEYVLSNEMQTNSVIYWPRAVDTRLVFMNARTGRRAAAAKIRVYRIDGNLPALSAAGHNGRRFVNWYEEGNNYLSLYGAPDTTPEGFRVATERWAGTLKYMGGNILSPAVVVYDSALYPSRYNRHFSISPDNDVLRRMLLTGEKYGIQLLPEFHPRADELAWPFAHLPDPKLNQLVSRDGKTLKNLPPRYNPIYPANQDWYVNMIGELVDNYKDSPALLGVSLRLMQWQNPTLNNFHSLDWGYDDYTIERFQKETGLVVADAPGDPGRFRKRYDWLMINAREKWIAWRCQKIAELYVRLRDRVRQARKDLKLFSYVFDGYEDYPNTPGWLRGAGVDTKLLSQIDGVVLVNALHAYGRGDIHENDLINQTGRDNLLDPEALQSMITTGGTGRFLSYSRYFEALPSVIPPQKLGFSDATKTTMMSAVVNPAGRHFLERYAVELAETDATLLGDGGNGYTLGQPYLREFLKEYLLLPPVPFVPRADARDPVAVWELPRTTDYLFYVVNREGFPIKLYLQIQGQGKVYRLTTKEPVMAQNGRLTLQLDPYQLITFGASAGTRITGATTIIPASEELRVSNQVKWLEVLSDETKITVRTRSLSHAQQTKLKTYAAQARNALNKKWTWRARTILENHELIQIYQQIGEYPPRLRDTASKNVNQR